MAYKRLEWPDESTSLCRDQKVHPSIVKNAAWMHSFEHLLTNIIRPMRLTAPLLPSRINLDDKIFLIANENISLVINWSHTAVDIGLYLALPIAHGQRATKAPLTMTRSKAAPKLDEWLEAVRNSLIGSFAGSVEKNLEAVSNAIISPWSNGQTEVQITRLKLIKRQTYERAKLDLLQARLIGAS